MSDNFLVRWEVNFTRIPNWLLTYRDKEDKSLSPQAIKVYIALASFADNNTMEAFPSQALLAERADMSTRMVQRYLKELKDLQVIEVFKKHNGKDKWVSNIYRLKVTPPLTMTDSQQKAIEAEVEENVETSDKVSYDNVNLGMTQGKRPRKRTLNDEIWDGFVEFKGSGPIDNKIIGDWISNIPRLIKIFKAQNVDPMQFKQFTMAACAAFRTRYTEKIALNPRTLADNWENIKPEKYNKSLIEGAQARLKYGATLPEGVTVGQDGRIILDQER